MWTQGYSAERTSGQREATEGTMGVDLILPPQQPFAELHSVGIVTEEDADSSTHAWIAWAKKSGDWLVLTDCRMMAWTPADPAIRALVESEAARLDADRYREAFVLPEDDDARATAERYLAMMVERGLQIRGFVDRDDALAWLREEREATGAL